MFSLLRKKKVNEDKIANIIVNSIFESVDKSFHDVTCLINEDPAFEKSPNLSDQDSEYFLFIVICGNINNLYKHFSVEQASKIETKIIEKLAVIFEKEFLQVERYLGKFQSYINSINKPSKNFLYGMSKALFYKYDLNDFQDDYFKKMRTPNPIFLKRMDEVMDRFLWDWKSFNDKYKISV
ncbi:MAG: hypothetical protein R2799_02280 [Crocinitomicaceae bacterium]